MKFQSIKTSELDKKQIDQILNLKNTYWKYGYESQLTWFKKNSHKNDVHNLIIINDEIVGYTFLGNRTFEILHLSKIIKKLPYILSLCIGLGLLAILVYISLKMMPGM